MLRQEHCLLGIRGNLQRSHDGHILHTNIDTDVIVSEEPPLGSTEKPEELYDIIERFAAGRCANRCVLPLLVAAAAAACCLLLFAAPAWWMPAVLAC